MKTWNPTRLQTTIAKLKLPEYIDDVIIQAAHRLQKKLLKYYEAVQPVCKRGLIYIDFDKCTLDVLASINFAARKPPDASAAFEEKSIKAAMEVLNDLALVISSYMTTMIVCGKTGQT